MFEILVICLFGGFKKFTWVSVNDGEGEWGRDRGEGVYRKILHKCSIEYLNTHRS